VGGLVLLWLLVLGISAHAHAPDTSYLRAVVSKHALELRFTFDLSTLYRIERLDSDNDGKVTRAEAEKVAPEIADFLRKSIVLEVNGKRTAFGDLEPLGWPVDAGEVAEEKNYGQTLLHFTFAVSSPKIIEDFYVLYDVFAQLGAVHRAVANIEQEGKHWEVVFTQFEPDYVYDTFWREEAIAKQDFRGAFRGFLGDAWTNFCIPLIVLAAMSLHPRKLPAVVALALLCRQAWRYFAIAEQYGSTLSIAGAMLGVLAAMVVCGVIVLPAALVLRRWRSQFWFVIAAWAVLILGGIGTYGTPMNCFPPAAPIVSKSG
jgi:hypothetical protein